MRVQVRAAPLRHALQRNGGRPAALVGAVGRDGVVHIADGRHAGHQVDFGAAQTMRVALAVQVFVVVQAGIEYLGIGNALLQQGVALPRVQFHVSEFLVRQGAGLVQNVRVGVDLAHVVQQPGQRCPLDLMGREAELACQRHHQGADRDRMHIGIGVGVFQAHDAEQRSGMALDRLLDLLGQCLGLLRLDGVAHACLVEHLRHRRLRLLALLAGLFDLFLPQARRVHRGGRRGRCGDGLGRGGGGLHVQAPCQVDPQARNTAGLQALQIGGCFQLEATFPKTVAQPRTIQRVDIHAQAQLRGNDMFQHQKTI